MSADRPVFEPIPFKPVAPSVIEMLELQERMRRDIQKAFLMSCDCAGNYHDPECPWWVA